MRLINLILITCLFWAIGILCSGNNNIFSESNPNYNDRKMKLQNCYSSAFLENIFYFFVSILEIEYFRDLVIKINQTYNITQKNQEYK